MSKGYTVRPWRPIDGSGQSISLTTATHAESAAFGTQTYAFAIRLTPAATAFLATFRVSNAGTAATASKDYPISSSDPTMIVGCMPGDKVSIIQSSGSTQTVQICELTQ